MSALERNPFFLMKVSSGNSNHDPVSETSCASVIKSEFIADFVKKEEIGVSLDKDGADKTYCSGLFIQLDQSWRDGTSHFKSANVKTERETVSSHSNVVSHQKDLGFAGESYKIDVNTEAKIQEPHPLSNIFPANSSQQCDAIKEDDASHLSVVKFKPDFEVCKNGEHFDRNIPASFNYIEPTCSRAYRESLDESQHSDTIVQDNASLPQLIKRDPNVRDDINDEYFDKDATTSFGDREPSSSEAIKESLHKSHQPPKVGQNPNQVILKELRVVLKDLYPKKLNAGSLEQSNLRCGKINGSRKLKDSKYRGSMQDRLKSHAGPILTCAYCPRQFDRKRSLIVHLRTHEDRPYPCIACALKFRHYLDLGAHSERIHSDEVRFFSKPCPARFKKKNTFQCRLADHATERLFSCDSCQKKFKSENSLRKHMMTHFDQPQEKQCSRKESHKKLFHLNPLFEGNERDVSMDVEENKFPCDKCKAEFDDKVDESILCEGGCYGRFHLRCAGLSKNDFEKIVLFAGKVIWICETCKNYRTTEVIRLQREKMEGMTRLKSVEVEKDKLSTGKEALRVLSKNRQWILRV